VERDPDALRDYVRSISKTVFHPAGTAKMGPSDDRMALVGEDLKVRNVERLRVADASIMPTLVSANTNAPTMMIGERAAWFILGEEKPVQGCASTKVPDETLIWRTTASVFSLR
jgi:choline dehydrogenase-like flavoprotein